MCLQILWSQETWFPDGSVLCDGKMMRVEQIEQYRLSGSSRDRARKRGGTIVRATDSWIGYVHIWCLCKKMRVGAKHIHAWQAPSIRRKVHVYISLYIYTYIYIYMQYIYIYANNAWHPCYTMPPLSVIFSWGRIEEDEECLSRSCLA